MDQLSARDQQQTYRKTFHADDVEDAERRG
jgi:hypothetical protein